MNPEIDLYGVFIPSLLLLAVLALSLTTGLRLLLARLGLYRLVWHRSLFNFCLFVVVLSACVQGSLWWRP